MPMVSLFAYFTTYTVIWTILSVLYRIPHRAMEVLRGMVSIVAISVAYIYIRYGSKVIQQFYLRFGLHGRMVFLYDLLIHFVPLWVVGGFPRSILGFASAYAIFLIWFLSVRQMIGLKTLYSPAIPKEDYDRWAFLFLPAILLAIQIHRKK